MINVNRIVALAAMSGALLLPGMARAEEVVKITIIDPQSGLMGPVGASMFRQWQYAAEMANREGWAKGIKFEVQAADNKLSPQESLSILKSAIDSGVRYVAQGNGSGVGVPLQQAVQKHNERNPDEAVLYMNYAAVDPVQTNENCTFSHFRTDANVDMKVLGIVNYLAKNMADTKKVYLINQDYSFGHSVAKAAHRFLKEKMPSVEVVGEDLHPLARVTDFSQYAAKIKASGADAIITGNWGSDLALLVKAAKDAGVDAKFFTFYAGTTGVPTQIGAAGEGRVYMVDYVDRTTPAYLSAAKEFKEKYNDDFYVVAAVSNIRMLSEAMNKVGSTDPLKVAGALEGLSFESVSGTVQMRADDHQLQQPLFISSWQKVDGDKVKFDQEGTGYGWRLEHAFSAEEVSQPTTCQMKRPS